jgi:transcriptional regulator with XRE-family HTH domain
MGNKKAKPTEADKAAARRLRAIWDERARGLGLTQDKMAAKMDGSQGLVSQYLNGLIPLNYRALLSFSDALGIDPATVRTDLQEQALTASGLGARSQVARLDPVKIVITTRAINRILDRRHKGLTLDLADPLDAELFAEVYAECEAMPASSEADMVAVVADLMMAREAKERGKEREQAGSTDRGKGRKARTG